MPTSERATQWERRVPAIRAVRSYQRGWLRPDLVAGLVLAAILVPQGMAYAELAGLPPVTGLYTTIACLIGYAVFGPSRVLVLGPDSSVSPLIFAAIIPLMAADDPATAIALAGMLAVLVGLIEIGLGLGKLGFVADLLSNEVQVGYMNGLAITIIIGQLPKLFGFSTDADGFVEEVEQFVRHLDDTNSTTLITGLAVLAVLLVLPRVAPKVPAVLVGVVAVTIASAVFDLAGDGVSTVGSLPRGVPVPALPWTNVGDVAPLLIAAAGITLVSLTDTIATATSFAARRGDEVEPDQEMVGMGAANLAAGVFQGFAVSTSGSRTAVAEQSGARSQLTGVVGAGLVAVLLLFLNSLLADLPQTALAAVVITAALSLADLSALRRYLTIRPSSFMLSIVATVGVVLFGVLEGILIADRPVDPAVLPTQLVAARRCPGARPGRRGVARPPDLPRCRAAPRDHRLPLGVAAVLRERDGVPHPDPPTRPRAVAEVGRPAVRSDHRHRRDRRRHARALDDELNAQGVHLVFVEMRHRLQDLILRYGLFDTLDREHFYDTLESALDETRALDDSPPGTVPPDDPGGTR